MHATTPPPSSIGRRLEELSRLGDALLCGIDQPAISSMPKTGPCWFEPNHEGPCSWAVHH